ncbi:MAG: redoxin domain-containing protein, partial [Bacteroidales bacterium]|nr:redoxin domain-containing protein [Bacteroidales bacterium]
MKKIALFFFATMLLLGCGSTDQNQNTIEISGKIRGLGDESMVLRYRFDGTTYMDTITAQNDVISFKKEIELPHLLWATLQYIGENEDILVPRTGFFIENGIKIVLDGNLADLDALNVKNSPHFNEVIKLRNENRELTQELWNLSKFFTEHPNEVGGERLERYRAISKEIEENTKNFIENNKNSVYAAFLFSQNLLDKSVEEIEAGFEKFTKQVQNSVFGEQIRKYIETARSVAPGAVAPNFTQEDINGNIITLEQFRGEYVMLVFWGSWCGPCRRSHPHLMDLVHKYKNSPIQFIGFASDKDINKWKVAI